MPQSAEFSLRIVTADSYTTKPTDRLDAMCSDFGVPSQRVPIIRIFGSTPAGQTVCMHIHRVFPYIYVPYDGTTPANMYVQQFATSLDHALNLYTAGGDAEGEPDNQETSAHVPPARQHVFKISVVKGIPFYGFYQNDVMYLKIYFYSAQSIKRATKLLLSGAVLRKKFQPYESHIPYLLQFFMDCNLQGMNFINVSKWETRSSTNTELCKDRARLRGYDAESSPDTQHVVIATTYHAPNMNVFPNQRNARTNGLKRMTTCELEIDVLSDDILNREEIEIKIGTNPGLEAIWRDENQRRSRRGLQPIVNLPQSQERDDIMPTRSEKYFAKRLDDKLAAIPFIEQENTPTNSAVFTSTADVTSNDGVLVGIASQVVGDELAGANSSFYLDRHSDTTNSSTHHVSLPNSDSVVDEEQIQSLQQTDSSAPSTEEMERILTELAAMADENLIEANDRNDPGAILRQDEEETREMNTNALEISPEMDWESKISTEINLTFPSNQLQYSFIDEDEATKTPPEHNAVNVHPASVSHAGSGTVESAISSSGILPCATTDLPGKDSKQRSSNFDIEVKEQFHKQKNVNTEAKSYCNTGKSQKTAKDLILSENTSVQKTNTTCILTPVVPFPSMDEVCRTAGRYGLHRTVRMSAYYSSIAELAQDLLPEKDNAAVSNVPDLKPIEELVEFEGSSSSVKSSVLFESGIRYVQGERKGKSGNLSRSKKLLPAGATDAVTTGQPAKWTVMLTPAITFPNLSHITRMQQRAAIVTSVPTISKIETDDATLLDFYDIEHGNDHTESSSGTNNSTPSKLLALRGEKTNSAQKARKNTQFERIIGHDLGSPLQLSNKNTPKSGDGAVLHESENLVLMSLELHADVRDGNEPDPRCDSIRFVTYCLMTDTGEGAADGRVACLYVDPAMINSVRKDMEIKRFISWLFDRKEHKEVTITFVANEQELISLLIERIRSLDPDMLVRYEVQLSSWGYLIERGHAFGFDMLRLLSRLIKPTGTNAGPRRRVPQAVAEYEARKMSEYSIVGREILNLWRLMRHEVNLNIYSFENVVFHVLKLRIHLYSSSTLAEWFSRDTGHVDRWRAMEYLILRTSLNAALLNKLDVIRQTSEFSRLFGIQFYETLTRGSQWRVESMMLRLAKPFSFVPVSPSGDQLKAMGAPESLPLILEPESRFYQDPVIVLDFQSLYPSMIIAYNYCFSTCLGKVEHLGSTDYFKFGCTAMRVPPPFLKQNQSKLHFSPNGVAFVHSSVRRGILPKMLEQILNTRIMVKKSMADYKDNPVLKKLLHARQLGLKLIANVTYGYTSASFSGRMPCVEIGDTIVAKARETLELAMKHIESNPRWKAKIVYGDTDSMFVLLPGRTRMEAFRIGREIEKAITDLNPKPVKLKFEKVYLPCVLQTKKRYCGYMYETEDQIEPVFDAKGIETVRRDTCPLVSKTLEQMIRMLFAPNCDILSVKQLIRKRFFDVLMGNTPMPEFIFAKEYRGRETYKEGARVPALEIAKKMTSADPRAEPRIGERVPYIIVYGSPKDTLISLVKQPYEIFHDPSLRPHGFYYCSRQLVPVLNRVLLLMGLDSKKWLFDVQERLLFHSPESVLPSASTDLVYFRKFCSHILLGSDGINLLDEDERIVSTASVTEQYFSQCSFLEHKVHTLTKMCAACMGSKVTRMECESFDCPVLFQLLQTSDRLARKQIARNTAEMEEHSMSNAEVITAPIFNSKN